MTYYKFSKLFLLIGCILFNQQLLAQEFVNVKGNKIHYEKKGVGIPCVIFVSGYGDPLESFDSVFNEVAKVSTAIRYSRSGIGKSSYSNKEKDFDSIVTELDSFIKSLKIVAPYILIGHSYGGLIVRSYAKIHPDKVGGLLLDDATFEDYFERLSPYDKDAKKIERQEHEDWLKTDTSKATDDEFKSLWNVWHSPANWKKWFEPLPQVPVFIMTSMKVTGASLRNSEAVMYERYLAHDIWTKYVPFSMHIGLTTAGHFIHSDEPKIFIGVVDMLLNTIRQKH
jgi:pimeloyl-ACP methyl ester carboxylesterase